ncbi:hypothetical protein FGO68_gene16302 [Halteria grandinella]|uniref:Peptidase A1 domain-containing protein n=1 Tax=Halteria grandinella TaxID=5974 RepID=A0A8J8NQA5_HALGN|nr:hypothetical protein FGO68_gene16302 [Halteria grandinella]
MYPFKQKRAVQLLSLTLLTFLFSSASLASEANQSMKLPLRKTPLSRPRAPRPPRTEQSLSDQVYNLFTKFDNYLQGKRKFPLGTVNYDMDIENKEDILYTAEIYVGSGMQKFDVTLDTGSNKLILNDKSCLECQGATFDTSTSTTYVNTGVEDEISYLDGSYVVGYKSTDTVAFDDDSIYSATTFNFLLGLEQKGFEKDDGLIGLTRYNDNEYNIIVDQLYQQGKISSGIFSFYLAESAEQSTFQLGGYDSTYIKNSASLSYIPLSDSTMFWDVNVQAFRVGLDDFNAKGQPMGWAMQDVSTACLDTGTSLMYLPKRVFPKVIKALLKGLKHLRSSGYYYGPCDTSLYQSIYIMMGDTWFEIPPSVFVEASPGYQYCFIEIGASEDDTWLLGDTFLMNYYSVWDNDNNQVGLAPHITSTASTIPVATLAIPTTAYVPYTVQDIALEIVKYAGIVGVSGVVIGGLSFLGSVLWETIFKNTSLMQQNPFSNYEQFLI